ncbi:hypothetical protein [Arthrobacter sp. A5]|uniref:hypothetical protein n=1 Tax=Arthrobacter sp. A5 TaxID=576926 RepID=UPI003DA93631
MSENSDDESEGQQGRNGGVPGQDFPLLTADYDLVLAHRLPNSPACPRTLNVEPLVFEPLDVAMSRSHPLAGKERLTGGFSHGALGFGASRLFPGGRHS